MTHTALEAYERFLRLDQGGMAEVWLAVRKGPAGFRKLLVVKQLHAQLASDPMFVSMFLDEARLAAELNHPNIVQTLEVGEQNHTLFLVMEYLEGQTLRALRERCDVPLEIELAICRDVLRALDYAHNLRGLSGAQLGIVHRDISPDNIVITYDGVIKLVDFGVAKAASARTETTTGSGMYRGKLTYMAPEQALDADVDRRADLFSVGAILWEALSHRRLWGDSPNFAILRQLTAGEIPRIPWDVRVQQPELAQICERAMQSAPEQRFPSADVFSHAIDQYMASHRERAESRELGAFMLDHFGEERSRMRSCVEQQLAKLRNRGTIEVPSVSAAASIGIAAPPPIPPTARLAPTVSSSSSIPAQVGGRYVVRGKASGARSGLLEGYDPRTRTQLWIELHHSTRFEEIQPKLRQICEVRHPVLLNPVDAGPLTGGAGSYVVWQRPDGISLQEILATQTISALHAVDLVGELARGLARAHRLGMAHGSISLESIFIASGPGSRAVRLTGLSVATGRTSGPPHLPHADVAALCGILRALLDSAGANTGHGWDRIPALAALLNSEEHSTLGQSSTCDGLLNALDGIDRGELLRASDNSTCGLLAVATGHSSRPIPAPRELTQSETRMWFLSRDPALRSPDVRAALQQAEGLGTLRLLDEAACMHALAALQSGDLSPPHVIVFGDLDILLRNPLLAALSEVPEVSRVLISNQANAEMLQMAANGMGMEQQICLPATPGEIGEALRAAVECGARRRDRCDGIRTSLLRARTQAAITAVQLTNNRAEPQASASFPKLAVV